MWCSSIRRNNSIIIDRSDWLQKLEIWRERERTHEAKTWDRHNSSSNKQIHEHIAHERGCLHDFLFGRALVQQREITLEIGRAPKKIKRREFGWSDTPILYGGRLLDLSWSTFYIILYHMTLNFPSYTTLYMVRLPDATHSACAPSYCVRMSPSASAASIYHTARLFQT